VFIQQKVGQLHSYRFLPRRRGKEWRGGIRCRSSHGAEQVIHKWWDERRDREWEAAWAEKRRICGPHRNYRGRSCGTIDSQ